MFGVDDCVCSEHFVDVRLVQTCATVFCTFACSQDEIVAEVKFRLFKSASQILTKDVTVISFAYIYGNGDCV